MKHDEKSTTHYACDIGIANGSCCGCSGHHCHQRPESGWREEWNNHPANERISALEDFGFAHGFSNYEGEIIQDFIARIIAAERKTAYDQGVKDTNFQMARLLENNKLLTEKLRALTSQQEPKKLKK